MSLNELAKEIHDNAKEKGFWYEERNKGECIALMHSELSEALEELRKGKPVTEIYTYRYNQYQGGCESINLKDGEKPEGVPSELADCIIRILDFCGAYNIDIDKAINLKMKYNKTRPVMHGKKF